MISFTLKQRSNRRLFARAPRVAAPCALIHQDVFNIGGSSSLVLYITTSYASRNEKIFILLQMYLAFLHRSSLVEPIVSDASFENSFERKGSIINIHNPA